MYRQLSAAPDDQNNDDKDADVICIGGIVIHPFGATNG